MSVPPCISAMTDAEIREVLTPSQLALSLRILEKLDMLSPPKKDNIHEDVRNSK